MKSLQIPNKLKGKEILKRKTKVIQPSSQLASNRPQHSSVDLEHQWACYKWPHNG